MYDRFRSLIGIFLLFLNQTQALHKSKENFTSETTTARGMTTTTTQSSSMPKLLHTDVQYEYFKVAVDKGTKMTTGKVSEACKEAGLKAVCPGPRGCKYNTEAHCYVTPLSSDCHWHL